MLIQFTIFYYSEINETIHTEITKYTSLATGNVQNNLCSLDLIFLALITNEILLIKRKLVQSPVALLTVYDNIPIY